MEIMQVSPTELNEEIAQGKDQILLDVREPFEVEAGAIPGITNIPLGMLPMRQGELDKNAEIVTICKLGGRSTKAAEFLTEAGFSNVRNMTGGVTAWKEQVDPNFVVG